MNLKSLSYLIPFLILFSCSGNVSNNSEQIDEDIETIIAKMSIEEKVGQMTQINLDVVSKGEIFKLDEPHELDLKKLDVAVNKYFIGSILNVGGHTYSREHWEYIITTIQEKATAEGNKIPILYGIDAIHGVNYTMDATLFPQQIGQAATWNPEIVERGAAIAAYECRASGIPWNFSPVMDLARQPLWSRFFETYGEDVYLAKQMTAATVRGYQGDDPSHPEKVAACMKHFLGYSMPISGKDRTPAWIPERQLREYFLPTFQEAIAQNALTLMVNSGELNGIPVHADYDLLTTLLRDELGFKGLVVTDWEDIIKLYRDHKVAKDMRDAVKMAVLAGIDMSMTPNDYSFNDALIDLVKTGEVPESRLDESCRRILWVKKQLGILKNPIPKFESYKKFGSKEFKNVALESALESITLLKNQNKLLPLKRDAKLLVCGPAANSLNIINGAWTHTWQGVDSTWNTKGAKTILTALKSHSTGQITFVAGSSLNTDININEAVAKGKSADAILVCLGELPSTEKPGDIEDLNLPEAQQNLVLALSKLNKPIILTFSFNRPLLVNAIEPHAQAIIHTYLPGDTGGEALAQILYGASNPSGKLPFTYPRYPGSLLFYDHKSTELLDKNFGFQTFNPQWEFGHGLSYSSFSYSNLIIDKKSYQKTDYLKVSVDVKNDSAIDGKEVIQVYITDLIASITPSIKRLRGFKKVKLKAQETQTVHFEIPIESLSFVGKDNKWIVETGDFVIQVDKFKAKFKVK